VTIFIQPTSALYRRTEIRTEMVKQLRMLTSDEMNIIWFKCFKISRAEQHTIVHWNYTLFAMIWSNIYRRVNLSDILKTCSNNRLYGLVCVHRWAAVRTLRALSVLLYCSLCFTSRLIRTNKWWWWWWWWWWRWWRRRRRRFVVIAIFAYESESFTASVKIFDKNKFHTHPVSNFFSS